MTKDIALRRHAFEIVSQLPENPREARVVLEYVQKLMDMLIRFSHASTAYRTG